ncbi:MAG: Mrp/NBP35 family ATP-binding protein [Clostridia bacterium]|nr:Mrp/NBP35 family ATP-binding protein [Clostridia bacterium]
MSECTHDCSNCSENCGERRDPKDFLEKPHEGTSVHKVIGVVSGKGGVGKSMVTSMLAVLASRAGYRAAVLDADITGPSIPKVFGLHDRAMGTEDGILPVVTPSGVKVMSLNLLVENETDPVVWRGPVIAGAVKQFWTDVLWGEVDYMFVDMPPGTGDVPLTVFQSLPLDGIVIVTSPQELVSMIVEKAVNMANMMNIPVLGIVENMAYFECPDCGKRHHIFGESHVEGIAAQYGIPHIAQMPIDSQLAALADSGEIENVYGEWLDDFAEKIRG